MSVVISGSLAYDYIMDFPDSFKNHILPDKIHILSVSFVVNELKKNYGGVGGNIAYTMKLLGAEPTIFGSLGKDGSDYLKYLKEHNISTKHITKAKKTMSSAAHITTDKDDNQITAFFPGPGVEATSLSLSDVSEPKLMIVGPTAKEAMIEHSKQAYEAGVPIVFQPGQQTSALSAQELSLLVGQATFVIANDYEMQLIEDKTGWDNTALLDHADIIITTLGSKGSRIQTKDTTIEVTPCTVMSVDDPTGAGDAYTAGFFAGYAQGKDLETCGRMASVAASYAIESYGTQSHSYTKDEFQTRFEKAYNEAIVLE